MLLDMSPRMRPPTWLTSQEEAKLMMTTTVDKYFKKSSLFP